MSSSAAGLGLPILGRRGPTGVSHLTSHKLCACQSPTPYWEHDLRVSASPKPRVQWFEDDSSYYNGTSGEALAALLEHPFITFHHPSMLVILHTYSGWHDIKQTYL